MQETKKGNFQKLYSTVLKNGHIDGLWHSLLPSAGLCCLQMYFLTIRITNYPWRENLKPPQLYVGYNSSILLVLRVTDDDLLVWFRVVKVIVNMLMHPPETTHRSI